MPAQTGWIVGARVAAVEHRLDGGFGVERFTGLGLGVEGTRRFGRITVGLSAQGARLRAAATDDLDRRVGELDTRAAFAVAPWWGFYSGVTLRAVASDAGHQRWALARIGVEARPAFTGGNAQAIARLGVIPLVAVSGLQSSSFGFDGAVGLDYTRKRVTLGLLYNIERFAFLTGGGMRRSEQFSTLILRGGVRLGPT